MFKQISSSAKITTGPLPQVISSLPASPIKAFGRRVEKPAPQRVGAGQRKQRPPDHQRSVLVVDDVADVTEMIGLFLKHAGYQVAIANSAEDALRMAQDKTFDLIVSDIGMPEMNGYELATSLRQRAEYQGIPIIAVTGYTEYDDSSRARRAGFNAHLIKPIDPSELLRLITELLD